MSNRLENFIRDNREAFDSEEPAPQVWKKLDKQLSPIPSGSSKGKLSAMVFLRWSAAAAIIILAGLGIWSLLGKSKTEPPIVKTESNNGTANKPDDILNEINPTYAKEVYHFTQLIELKQSELKQLEKENPALYKQFIADINKLDSSYNALKKELPANANREQLLEAMIQNLKLQTELLNQQLQIIQQINQSKQKRHESTSKNI